VCVCVCLVCVCVCVWCECVCLVCVWCVCVCVCVCVFLFTCERKGDNIGIWLNHFGSKSSVDVSSGSGSAGQTFNRSDNRLTFINYEL